MSGFPYNNLAQHVSLFPSYYTIDENGHATIQTNNFMHSGPMPHLPAYSTDSGSSTIDYDDPAQSLTSASSSSKSRRRIAGSGEHVKFRRTRSGCYTCRNRRVKCDETRPICERCKKGSRDCIYPEPMNVSKARRSSQREKDVVSSAESEGDDFDEEILTSSVSASNDRDTTASLSPVQSEARMLLSPVSEAPGKPSDLTTSPNSSRDANILSRARSISASAWDSLPKDIQFYLSYAKMNLTSHHWNYAADCPEGLCNILLDAAMRYEPLMYAVACFAAYHYSLKRPDGKIEDFLTYHSKSVLSLGKALKKGDKRNLATLLTILQLATIEECLGDWVNLMNHQKAAHQLMTESYSPESIMRHSTLRNILMWYLHFDTYVGMLSGNAQIIAREWLISQDDFYVTELETSPDNINYLLGEVSARSKLLGYDIFELFSQANSGELSQAEVAGQLEYYADIFENFENTIPSEAKKPECLIIDFTGAEPRDSEDLFDPYEPGLIYGGECFATNQVIIQTIGLRIIYETRLGTLNGKPRTDLIKELTIRMAKMINAIHYWPDKKQGALLTFRANISLVAFMLPPGDREKNWTKKKFAAIESQGYIYPKSIRARTQAAWGEDGSNWWLPDNGSVPPVIRQIREFTAERTSTTSSAAIVQPNDKATNLREMRGIFNSLNMSDASSPESIQSPGSSSNLRASASSDKRSPAAIADEIMTSPPPL